MSGETPKKFKLFYEIYEKYFKQYDEKNNNKSDVVLYCISKTFINLKNNKEKINYDDYCELRNFIYDREMIRNINFNGIGFEIYFDSGGFVYLVGSTTEKIYKFSQHEYFCLLMIEKIRPKFLEKFPSYEYYPIDISKYNNNLYIFSLFNEEQKEFILDFINKIDDKNSPIYRNKKIICDYLHLNDISDVIKIDINDKENIKQVLNKYSCYYYLTYKSPIEKNNKEEKEEKEEKKFIYFYDQKNYYKRNILGSKYKFIINLLEQSSFGNCFIG